MSAGPLTGSEGLAIAHGGGGGGTTPPTKGIVKSPFPSQAASPTEGSTMNLDPSSITQQGSGGSEQSGGAGGGSNNNNNSNNVSKKRATVQSPNHNDHHPIKKLASQGSFSPTRFDNKFPSSSGSGVQEPSMDEELNEMPVHETFFQWAWRCTKLLITIVLPVAFSASIQNLNLVYTYYIAGTCLTRVEFAGMAMGITFMNMTANGLGVGMTFALDTLVSQEVGRNPKSKRVGLYLQRSIVVTGLVFLLLNTLYFFSKPVVDLIIAPAIATPTAYFLRYASLICVPTIGTGALQKVVQCLGLSHIGLYGSIVGSFAVPFILHYFKQFGLDGMAVAIACHRMVILLTMVVLVCFRKEFTQIWPGWSWQAFKWKGLRKFINVGLPCVWSYCADLWGFEAMAVLAGYLGALQVAGWVLSMNLCNILWGLSTGICAAGSVRVGQALGAGDSRDARLMKRTVTAISVIVGLAAAIFVRLNGTMLMNHLQHDESVIELASKILNWTCAGLFLNVQFYVLQGLFRGCGIQHLSVRFVVIAYWIVGIPLALYLVFKMHMGIHGIMMAFVCGMSVACPILFYILFFTLDLDDLALQVAMKREKSAIEMMEDAPEEEAALASNPRGAGSGIILSPTLSGVGSNMSHADSYGTFQKTDSEILGDGGMERGCGAGLGDDEDE